MNSIQHYAAGAASFLFFIVLVISACSPSPSTIQTAIAQTRIAVTEPKMPTSIPPSATQDIKPINGVGDTAEINSKAVTLNSVEITTEGLLKANFTIENRSTETTNIGIDIRFSARDVGGVVLENASAFCHQLINAPIISRDKIRGDICWGATSSNIYKIYYEDIFVADPIVWEVSP